MKPHGLVVGYAIDLPKEWNRAVYKRLRGPDHGYQKKAPAKKAPAKKAAAKKAPAKKAALRKAPAKKAAAPAVKRQPAVKTKMTKTAILNEIPSY